MTTGIQQLVVGAIVVLAVLFLARRLVVSMRSARATAAGCGSDCGCEPPRKEPLKRG